VQGQLKTLPAKPGVYLFRDARGDVLYVGKAKSLRSRVRSYFQKTTDGRAQIALLPERVRRRLHVSCHAQAIPPADRPKTETQVCV